ncbi:ketoacyl-ACP synthase III [Paenibacillus crassostreae]|uniref:Beta-ketoacyl-[acyl-carrier-protein] synthase III n=1 Tax=Paenibacillus crassostreae TaxID=1763538 RepID=A0A162KVJ6_9BACL|nr:ketoacyl-ACP synthase III [Paenibacillus crassostreae]AOZ91229.1 ketoacyl-ACP synthase III [Paenibacillus crassostreae]OAB74613.1 3-oxoacyl-ACP synthase [Paenibacillus crassostreae]
MEQSKARITAIGSYVPVKRMTNFDLEKLVDTNDQWIVQRTGIRERRISEPDQYTSDMCVSAAQDLMRRYDKSLKDVDLILVATSTPDFIFPSVAALLQDKLGISGSVGAIDLSAACAGFAYALHVADGMVASGLHRKVLVFGADAMSKITDYTDRSTCILFGDGAGVVLVEADPEHTSFVAYHHETEGIGGAHVYLNGTAEKLNGVDLSNTGALVQNGKEVFRWAVRNVPEGIKALLEKSASTINDVDWFIPHSANLRIIEPICERTKIPLERTIYSLVNFGNTSAATIPLAIDLGIREGKIHDGERILIYGFGAGLTQAGLLLNWNPDKQVYLPESEL